MYFKYIYNNIHNKYKLKNIHNLIIKQISHNDEHITENKYGIKSVTFFNKNKFPIYSYLNNVILNVIQRKTKLFLKRLNKIFKRRKLCLLFSKNVPPIFLWYVHHDTSKRN